MDRSWLLLATSADHAATHSTACRNRACQRLYFDLGAGTWGSNADIHQPSQGWLYDRYAERGLEFDRIFGWEAREHAPQLLFS